MFGRMRGLVGAGMCLSLVLLCASASVAQPCACKVDLDGDGRITLTDIIGALDCADGTTPGSGISCDDADLNCDGTIDYCDAGVVWCQWLSDQEGDDCCDIEVPCGACCNEDSPFDPCAVTSRAFCMASIFTPSGYYMGDGTACDPGICQQVCVVDADCDDDDVCTTDTCTPEGFCAHGDVPNGTPVPGRSVLQWRGDLRVWPVHARCAYRLR